MAEVGGNSWCSPQDRFCSWFNRLAAGCKTGYEKKVLWAARDKLRELYFMNFDEELEPKP